MNTFSERDEIDISARTTRVEGDQLSRSSSHEELDELLSLMKPVLPETLPDILEPVAPPESVSTAEEPAENVVSAAVTAGEIPTMVPALRTQSEGDAYAPVQTTSRLIDVDVLKRRKTMKLDKSLHKHSRVRRQKMVLRVLFFPFYYSFWKNWFKEWQVRGISVLYIVYMYCTFQYSITPREPTGNILSNTEIFTPHALLVIVAIVMGRIAVTVPRMNFSESKYGTIQVDPRIASSCESTPANRQSKVSKPGSKERVKNDKGLMRNGENKTVQTSSEERQRLFRCSTTGHESPQQQAEGGALSINTDGIIPLPSSPSLDRPSSPHSPKNRWRSRDAVSKVTHHRLRKQSFKNPTRSSSKTKRGVLDSPRLSLDDGSATEDSSSTSSEEEFVAGESTGFRMKRGSRQPIPSITQRAKRKNYKPKSINEEPALGTTAPRMKLELQRSIIRPGKQKGVGQDSTNMPKLSVKFSNRPKVDTMLGSNSFVPVVNGNSPKNDNYDASASDGAIDKQSVENSLPGTPHPDGSTPVESTVSVAYAESTTSKSPKADLEEYVRAVYWDRLGQVDVRRMQVGDIRHAIENRVQRTKRSSSYYSNLAKTVACLTGALAILYRGCMYSRPYFCLLIYSLQDTPFLLEVPGVRVLISPYVTSKLCGAGCTMQQHGCFQDLISTNFSEWDVLQGFVLHLLGNTPLSWLTVLSAAAANTLLAYSLTWCILMAEEVYRKRLLYAKYYSKLTSTSKSRKYDLPHFRLNRVEHIKAWLNLRTRRTDTEREGIHRGADSVAYMVAFSTMLLVLLIGLKTVALMSTDGKKGKSKAVCEPLQFGPQAPSNVAFSDPEWQDEHGYLGDWMLILWTGCMSLYMQRFMTLTSKTNKKYKNTSLILTEQINLYIKVLRNKHLKDELMACNSMLGLAMKLIAELEEGGDKKNQKHKELVNPQVYNLLRVCLLSALGTMSSEYLGFKVRLWKL